MAPRFGFNFAVLILISTLPALSCEASEASEAKRLEANCSILRRNNFVGTWTRPVPARCQTHEDPVPIPVHENGEAPGGLAGYVNNNGNAHPMPPIVGRPNISPFGDGAVLHWLPVHAEGSK